MENKTLRVTVGETGPDWQLEPGNHDSRYFEGVGRYYAQCEDSLKHAFGEVPSEALANLLKMLGYDVTWSGKRRENGTIRVDLDEMTWHIRPSEQNAHVEVAYAFALTDDDSIVLRRTRDRSLSPSVPPRYHWRQYPASGFEPWNDDPAPRSGWRVARFAEHSASRRANGAELQREIRAAVRESETYNKIVHITLPEAQRPFVVGILRRMGAEWTDLGVENALDAWHEDPANPDWMLWRIRVNFRGPADELVEKLEAARR